jgi:hypothetical protein
MANPNAPFGLRPVRRVDGQTYHGGVNEYPVASATAANFGVGSLMKKTGSGNYVTVGTNGTAPAIGVCLGVRYQDSRGDYQFLPNWVSGTVTFNSQDAYALIVDDPNTVFEVQSNSTGVAAADIGQFAGLTVAGVDSNGNAIDVLDGADITGTADNLKILKLGNRPVAGRAANAYGAYAIVQVLIAIHELRGNPQAT